MIRARGRATEKAKSSNRLAGIARKVASRALLKAHAIAAKRDHF
jgi:hypothetical protein